GRHTVELLHGRMEERTARGHLAAGAGLPDAGDGGSLQAVAARVLGVEVEDARTGGCDADLGDVEMGRRHGVYLLRGSRKRPSSLGVTLTNPAWCRVRATSSSSGLHVGRSTSGRRVFFKCTTYLTASSWLDAPGMRASCAMMNSR